MTAQQDPSRGQRLLFTFLGCTLVGPFLAGFSVFAMLILARPLQLDGLIPVGVANPGHSALATFVWSAVPSALAAIGLAWPVWNHATFSWLSAAAAGAVGFMLASIAMPLPASLPLTPLALLAAFVALGVRAALVSGGIIRA